MHIHMCVCGYTCCWCLRKKCSSAQRAMCSDQHYDADVPGGTGYRYLSLFMPRSVSFAETGM